MSLSDCSECWETPCVCGYGYRNYTTKRAAELIVAVLKPRTTHDRLEIIRLAEEKLGSAVPEPEGT